MAVRVASGNGERQDKTNEGERAWVMKRALGDMLKKKWKKGEEVEKGYCIFRRYQVKSVLRICLSARGTKYVIPCSPTIALSDDRILSVIDCQANHSDSITYI